MSAEVYAGQETVLPPADVINTLPPEAQEQLCIDAAIAARPDDIVTLANAASLRPYGDPLMAQVYREAVGLPVGDYRRPGLLAGIARHPEAQVAWDEALLSAGETSKRRYQPAVHPLATIAAHQSDPVRLTQVLTRARAEYSVTEAQIVETVAKQFISGGHIGDALNLWSYLPSWAVSNRDGIALAMVEALAADPSCSVFDSWKANGRVSESRKILGQIKIAIHRGTKSWGAHYSELDKQWGGYDYETRLDAAEDLQRAGQSTQAMAYALRAVERDIHAPVPARNMQTSTIEKLLWREVTNDPDRAAELIQALRSDTERQLNDAILLGMQLPEDGRDRIRYSLYEGGLQDRLNLATRYEIAARVQQVGARALAGLETFQPYATDQELAGLYTQEARLTVARSLAHSGLVGEALHLVAGATDTFLIREKSNALITMAKDIKTRRRSATDIPQD